MIDGYNPKSMSMFNRMISSMIVKANARTKEEHTIPDCVIVDSFSGEENESNDMFDERTQHIWWRLRAPNGSEYIVRCFHDYDYVQQNIGNVDSQIGRYATICYYGSQGDIRNGSAKIQPDLRAKMPNPTQDSVIYSIGALGGVFDEDAMEKYMMVGKMSENNGPKVK